ncbi:MAG: ribosome-binding factor A [Candidatus Paceibacterota bacterium]|jgi:ribosome-binding factor A|nr:ribosome-binding factor A [Candidatus Paceibacterota bacterium]
MPNYEEKAGNLLMKLAGDFVARESNRTSLITVTRVLILEHGRTATFLISVLPDAEAETALAFLKRKRSDFRQYIKENTRLKTIPVVDFDIDKGEKYRQRIDEISRDL